MITELFLLFIIWVALAKLISILFGIPTALSIPIVISFLILYDMIPRERNNKAQEINTSNFFSMLRYLFFMLFVLFIDSFICSFSLYLETNGAKLIFPNAKWLVEILSLSELIGIREFVESLKITTVWGILSTSILFLGSCIIAHYFWGIFGSIQKIILKKREKKDVKEDLLSLINPFICLLFTGIITYLVFFPYIAKIGQLQIAKMVWPSDFQIAYQGGDDIIGIRQNYPDLNYLLQKHEGEFYKTVVTLFPWALLAGHLFAGFFTEVFFLHTLTHIGQIEARHAEVVHTFRTNIENLFRRAYKRFSSQKQQQEQLQQQEQEQQQISPQQIQQEQQERIIIEPYIDRRNGDREINTQILETTNSQFEETVNPEERLQRVIGSSETITPRQARMYPELYVVENRNGNYLIYTKDFYEKIMNNGRF
jgi:hypothetical protein